MKPGGPYGSIHGVARAAGLRFDPNQSKVILPCPFHDDANPSAFLDEATGCFYCSVCTPGHGWGIRRFAEALGGSRAETADIPATGRDASTQVAPTFSTAEAQLVWNRALARARDDASFTRDVDAYEYLRKRGVADAWEEGAFGVLAPGMPLPPAVGSWPATGHRIVVALRSASSCEIVNIQARAIRPAAKKTLFPKGSRAKGTLFASGSGLAVLRRTWTGSRRVILGEGLTDFLALVVASPIPVLSAPGAGLAQHGLGPWIADFDVWLALDGDDAGRRVLGATAASAYRHGARRVRRVIWPGHAKDACRVIEQRGVAALSNFLARELEEPCRD